MTGETFLRSLFGFLIIHAVIFLGLFTVELGRREGPVKYVELAGEILYRQALGGLAALGLVITLLFWFSVFFRH